MPPSWLFLTLVGLVASLTHVGAHAARTEQQAANLRTFQHCPYRRAQAFDCAVREFDLDHDRALSAEELESASELLLERHRLRLRDELKECRSSEGALTAASFARSSDECLPTCDSVVWFVDRVCQASENERSFVGCEHQREDAIECAQRYGDRNHDRLISSDEVDWMRSHYLSKVERTLVWIAEKFGLDTTREVMEKCDYDGDGAISEEDFALTRDTCLKNCDRVSKLFHFICDRAAAQDPAR